MKSPSTVELELASFDRMRPRGLEGLLLELELSGSCLGGIRLCSCLNPRDRASRDSIVVATGEIGEIVGEAVVVVECFVRRDWSFDDLLDE